MKNFPKNLVLTVCFKTLYRMQCKHLRSRLFSLSLCHSEFCFFAGSVLTLLLRNESLPFMPNRNTENLKKKKNVLMDL